MLHLPSPFILLKSIHNRMQQLQNNNDYKATEIKEELNKEAKTDKLFIIRTL